MSETHEYKPGDRAVIACDPEPQLTWWDAHGNRVPLAFGTVIEIVGRSSLTGCWRFRHPRIGHTCNVEARSIRPASPGSVMEGELTHTIELSPLAASMVGGMADFLASVGRGTVLEDSRVTEVDRATGERKEVGRP